MCAFSLSVFLYGRAHGNTIIIDDSHNYGGVDLEARNGRRCPKSGAFYRRVIRLDFCDLVAKS